MKKSAFLTSLFVILFNYSCAQDSENQVSTPENIPFTTELIIDEMQIPWGIAFLPDGGILVTEKSGELIHFLNRKRTTITNAPEVYSRGQGGLLDIEPHPDYAVNGWIYISYASSEGDEKGGHTALLRTKLKGNSLTNKELLYKAGPNTTKGQHFGSRIEFDNDGYLYLSIGERGARDENPQDITRDGGKIYRLNADGSVTFTDPDGNVVTVGGANPSLFSNVDTTGLNDFVKACIPNDLDSNIVDVATTILNGTVTSVYTDAQGNTFTETFPLSLWNTDTTGLKQFILDCLPSGVVDTRNTVTSTDGSVNINETVNANGMQSSLRRFHTN